ncbi:MAG TPA: FG-GAP-like repeat-containing protein [Mycobacteriales bacterium]
MRRALSRVLVVAVGAAALTLPASSASAIDPPTVRVTPGVSSVLVGGTRQLTATTTNLSDQTVTWSLRRGAGSVGASGLYTPPATVPADPVAVVRATAVEDPSVYADATITIASGVPGGGFAEEVASPAGGGQDADIADVTGDGKPDVVLLQTCCNGLEVWNLVTVSWNGSGLTRTTSAAGSTFAANGFTRTNDFVLDLELGDVDEDGDVDVYVPFGSTSTQTWRYQVWRNNGTGTFTPDAKVPTTGGARSGNRARLTDFDGDGHLDAIRLEWFGNLLFEKGNGNGTFQEPVALMSTFEADSFDVGDLTGDGRPDVAVGIKGSTNNSTTIEVGINNGFGAIASEVTYNVGMAPEPRIADTDGDGWNDLVVGVGGENYTFFPPKLLVLPNLANGTGAVSTTPVQLLPWRPRQLQAVHVDGDGVLDLAGYTYRGPVLLRRTGPNAYAPVHALSGSIHHGTFGDVTGDGRIDAFTNFDDASQFWPGSADTTLAFAIPPAVSRVNATLTATFTATLRNSVAEPKLTWSASRGTFSDTTYTAPASASPTGTAVTVKAALTGTSSTATRAITIVNDKFQFTSLGGRNVRQVVADPANPLHLYAATDAGVFRSTNGGASFGPLGTTTATGTDAKQVALVRDASSALRALAVFGTALYRIDVGSGDWAAAGAPASVASVSAVPDAPVVWLAAGGQVVRSGDAGSTWTPLGQTSVTEVDAVSATDVWVVRGAAPRVSRASFSADPSPALAMTPRELPQPGSVVQTLATHPADRTVAYVATDGAGGVRLYRDGGTGTWTPSPLPDVADRLSVSPSGVVLAGRSGTVSMYKSTDDGAAWHSINRGFTNVAMATLAHRGDGLDLVGTGNAGLYTPVEQVPPATPSITGGPSGTTAPGGANAFTFTFTNTGTTHLCALDDTAWASCSASKTYSGPLSSGEHTFAVVSVDENGNESPLATRTWTVDGTPAPVPTILTGPSGLVRSTSAAFTFELTGDATGAQCQLDSQTPATCVSGVGYTVGQGAHTFAVRSVDAAGNLSAAATRSWTVDTVPPAFPGFFQVPSARSAATSALFQWQSDQSATYACKVDNAPVGCSSSFASVSGLAEGQHTFNVVASDPAGNQSGNQYTWYVDLTDPAAPVLSATPNASTEATTAHFEFASPSDDASYYTCRLDTGGASSCFGTADYQSLTFGGHTFTVRTVDQAGRQSADTVFSWTIAVPAPVITSGPAALVNSRSATFAFTSAAGTTTACTLDGGAPAPCTSGVTYESLADGPHTFSVTASKNGATSAAATRAWTVDATAPAAPELTSVPPLRTASATAAFGWTPDDALTYACALDGSPVTCGTGAYTSNGLTTGSHTFVLTARDAALNAATASYTWTVDQAGPAVSLTSKPPARTALATATFEFGSAASDLAGYTCTVDGAAAACTSPLNLSSLTQGDHTFAVVARDDLGNNSVPATWAWTVDQTGPAVSLTAKPAARTASTAASFAFSSAAADLAGFTCTVDGVTSACGSPLTLSSLAAGAHSFSVVAKDDLANAGTPATWTWTVDTAGPDAGITAAPATLTNATGATFEFAAPDEDVASYTCTVDGVASACASPLVLSGLADGPHTFAVVAKDDLANAGAPATHAWTVDTVGPDAALTAKPPARTGADAATFEFAADGADHYVCTVDGAAGDCASPVTLSSLGEAGHTFAVVAYDALGNPGVPASWGWTVDVTGPAAAFTATPPALGNDTTPTFAFSSAAPDVASYECALDGVPEACDSPFTPTVSAGVHTLSVTATDDVGNAGEAVTFAWTVDTAAPVTSVPVPSAALTPTHTVTWNEPVKNVTAGTVRLLLTGTATVVPAALSCRTSANVAVACTATTVQRALLTPSAPLVPGQLYTLAVSGVTDLAGNASPGASRAYRASTVEQETSVGVRQAWRRAGWSGAQGGTYHVAHLRGATASYVFTGTGITWYGVRGPTYGLADVYVDNVLKASRVNFYSTTSGALTRSIGGLTNAKHTLKIVVRGERGSSSGKGTDVAVDAFKVGQSLAATPAVTFGWARYGTSAASGGAYAVEDVAGATVTITFRGRGIDWVTALGPNMGKATVVIDGVSKGTFDNWYSSARWGYVRTFSGLADRAHTMTITVLGQRRTGATGTNVVFDRLGVRP